MTAAVPVLGITGPVEDHLVDNENRPVTVVAEEVLHRVGWLHHAGTVNG